VLGDPVDWIDIDGLSKTQGITNANDPYLQRLKDTKGNRQEITKIQNEINNLRKNGKIKPERWRKLKAWIKLAKDGRLFSIWDLIGGLTEYELRKLLNCPYEKTISECMESPNSCLY
jgi:hypothetical protein